ncbi:MAG: McrC family protein [Prevotellaceae bacterium]|jgi:5-methylcytosine-specific restriction enzyme subunit McrC|nr:McrC family protein [Prevotellaceae bacterium]
MIILSEHFEYDHNKGFLNNLDDEDFEKLKQNEKYLKTLKRRQDEALCYLIQYRNDEEKYHFSTSYFVGIDWIIENQLSICVQPKLNHEKIEIDCLTMLFEALQDVQNHEHLDGLCEIYFDKPQIEITQQQDLLTPFLIVQFLQIINRIVQKGLKKTYYLVEKNLNSKVKGKIMTGKTLKINYVKNQFTKTFCRYDEFGFNGDENKILKKALLFARRAIQGFKLQKNKTTINDLINYISPAFETVTDDIAIDRIKIFKPNPMYREYEMALKLAMLILRRFSYNITQTENTKRFSPPFWIDMSKLFELYIFKKLRDIFPKQNEVRYHERVHYRELDFLINSDNREYLMIVDAKYKPRYRNHAIDIDDLRQVCAYARLEKIYEKLNIQHDKNIDCLIIYPHQDCSDKFSREDLKQTTEYGYVNFYKLGIALPEIQNQSIERT